MSIIAVIALAILAWISLAIRIALSVGRMISLRDRQRPDRTESATLVEAKSTD
ncbi:MAG: hypothetical protein M3257_10380 [Actinomycetota bacterium]|nr:hypothetical protein [Actinomycetota bacterium]